MVSHLLATLAVCSAPCSLALGTGPHEPFVQGSAPTIQSDVPENPIVLVERSSTFHLSVSEIDGDPVDLICLNPPVGLRFDPVRATRAPFQVEVKWEPGQHWNDFGARTIVFEARDADGSSRLSLSFTVLPTRQNHSPARDTESADLTNDGVLDLVVLAHQADSASVPDTGAAYVWRGGAPSSAPTATLSVPGALAGDRLGDGSFDTLQVGDVSGDGVEDVVIAAPFADGPSGTLGAVYVWRGGAQLTGNKEPLATLIGPGTNSSSGPLRSALPSGPGQPLLLSDVTGDGVLDILVASSKYQPGPGNARPGAVLVWEGGPDLVGTCTPSATLTSEDPQDDDRVGGGSPQAIWSCDITGDGIAEVIVPATGEDVGDAVDAGAVLVWKGGSEFSGQPPPTATLSASDASSFDVLGEVNLADVNADGIRDVIVWSSAADRNGVPNTGAIWFWKGRAAFEGELDPDATLEVPGAVSFDNLASSGVYTADVNGDGVLDILAPSPATNVGGTTNQGALFVFDGGSLNGTVGPWATLVDPAGGRSESFGGTPRLSDLTGDGITDIVLTAAKEVGGVKGAGALFVFAGGAALAGAPTALATLVEPTPSSLPGNSSFITRVVIEDVTGDGLDDIVTATAGAAIGGTLATGVVYVWPGGSSLAGQPLPTMLVEDPPRPLGYLGQRFEVGDLSGDGVADIVAQCSRPFKAQAPHAPRHCAMVWTGGPSLATGTPTAWASLQPSGFAARLESLVLRDLSGDGILDLIGEDSLGTVHGVENAGALSYWPGGPRLQTSPRSSYLGPRKPAMDDQFGLTEEIFADLSGDGVLDLTVLGFSADVGGIDTGAALYWTGPPIEPSTKPAPLPPYSTTTNAKQPSPVPDALVVPDVRFAVPGAANFDWLGRP